VLGPVLGAGGMGIVRRAWLYHAPGTPLAAKGPLPVAAKLLHPALVGRERPRRLLLAEATALQRLDHPGVVGFHALTEQDGQLVVIMELVEGVPLSRLIADQLRSYRPREVPCMPLLPAWHYFSQLLGALGAIHALGIVHRDVKPANVLVRHDGVVKVADFGIARVPSDQARLTGGTAPGTGAYMAPEQVRGQEPDARTDLYAAAIVLFELLTGMTPFERPGRSELEVRHAQLEEVAPPLTKLVPAAPASLDIFFARALAKNRSHRYASAFELGEALQSLAGLPPVAGWTTQVRFMTQAPALCARASDPSSKSQREVLRTELMTAISRT